MLDISDIPMGWLHALWDIQKVAPSAVIAGGALRDTVHGVPVKDLDIFIQAGDLDEAFGLFERLGGKPPAPLAGGLSDIDEEGVYPQSMSEVIMVTDSPLKHDLDITVQLIFVNWRTEHIHERFDIGLCYISCNGNEVMVSEEFRKDSDEKVINIRRCENKWMLGASINRYLRLKQKYPDFEIKLDGVGIKQVDTPDVPV